MKLHENGITLCSNIKTEKRDFLFPMDHFLFKFKNGRKGFSIPHEFDRKTVNLAGKNYRRLFMHLF